MVPRSHNNLIFGYDDAHFVPSYRQVLPEFNHASQGDVEKDDRWERPDPGRFQSRRSVHFSGL